MKFSLNYNVGPIYLQKADEIKLPYKERKKAVDLYEKYDKQINIFMESNDKIDIEDLKEINILCKGNLIIGCLNGEEMRQARSADLRFYFYRAINSYAILHDAIAEGVEQVILDSPLFNDLKFIKDMGVKIRAVANIASFESSLTTSHPNGCYIRPEDVKIYEPYIDIIEFVPTTEEFEKTCYRLYAEEGEWSGDLSMLVLNLNISATNRMIPPALAEHRLDCRQACMRGSSCRLCERTFKLATPEALKEVIS